MVAHMHSELLTVNLRNFHCAVFTQCRFSHTEIKESLLKTHKIASRCQTVNNWSYVNCSEETYFHILLHCNNNTITCWQLRFHPCFRIRFQFSSLSIELSFLICFFTIFSETHSKRKAGPLLSPFSRSAESSAVTFWNNCSHFVSYNWIL